MRPRDTEPMLELGVIADDLTGGVKVASLLEEDGVRCPVVTSVAALEDLGDVRAVVVGRKLLSRPLEEAIADAIHSAKALLCKGAKQLYYKYSALFSSTARGNIGPVAEALMDLTQTGRVLFCPGRPERDAMVYQGRLFLGRNMLHETPRRYDPVTPMTNSNLVEVLKSQSRVEVGLLNHRTMRAGKASCERFLAKQSAAGVRFFIVDVIDPPDLARVADLVRHSALTTGSDDLPVALARNWPARALAEPRTLLPPAPGHAAVISGSCTPKTGRQLARFEGSHPVFRIDLLKAAGNAGLVDQVVEWAQGHLGQGPVGVATTTDADGVRRAQAELGREGASALADDLVLIPGDWNDDVDESITEGRDTPYRMFVADTSAWVFPTGELSAAGATSHLRFTEVIDHILGSDEAMAHYEAESALAYRVDEYIVDYLQTVSDHIPVRVRFTPPGGT